MWALKSFYSSTGKHYALCIHDDGTLTNDAKITLCEHFVQARIIPADVSKEVVLGELQDHPNCRKFRLTNQLSPKVFDFRHFLNAPRMLLLDSDVLFFSMPEELINRVENPKWTSNSVNGDVASAYTMSPEEAKSQFGVHLIERFNSGLGVIHRQSLNFDWIEEFLAAPEIHGHPWRIEQTIYALCSSRFGVELLPQEYDVFLTGPLAARPSRHYVGAIRHLMYTEGISKLQNSLITK
ncbi:MAG: hypothetical protein NXI04_18765 [Planctomycetaceae bacterium]|nr:hypothetical protein [Planctomycetaceae bacterium]